MELKEVCPICEEGVLTEQVDQNEVSYRGHTGSIPCYYSTCSSCGLEQGSSIETNKNKLEMIEFKKRVDNIYNS